MGAAASWVTSDVKNTLTTQAYNGCDPVQTLQNILIKGSTFKPDKVCGASSEFVVEQVSTIESECLINSLQESLVKTILEMSSSAQAGLGISISKVKSNIESQVSAIVNNKCSGERTDQILGIYDTVVTTCKVRLVQNATAKSKCQISNLQKLSADVQAKITSEAKGWGAFDLGWIFGILIVLGVGGFMLKSSGGGKSSGGPIKIEMPKEIEMKDVSTFKTPPPPVGGNSCNIFSSDTSTTPSSTSSFINFLGNPYILMLILLLLLLIIVLISRYYRSSTLSQLDQITELNKQIDHAKYLIDTQYNYNKYHQQQQSQQPQQISSQFQSPAPEYSDDNLLSIDYHDDLNNYYVY